MTWIAIDCETIPDQSTGPDPESVKAPENYKDPIKIREYKLEHAQKQWEKTACNRWRCQVVAVSVLTDEMEKPELWMAMEEESVFARFAAWFDVNYPEGGPEPVWVGHNAIDFDFPILSLRAFKYGFTRLGREMNPGHPKWGNQRHRDTFVSGGGEGKLSDLARFFGVAREDTIQGKDIWKAWQTQRFQEIADHIGDDVITQLAVTNFMRQRGMFT